jgi:hypothetical protein
MPWVGFEHTIPVFERAMTFHALDRAATVIGFLKSSVEKTRFIYYRANTVNKDLFIKCSCRLKNGLNNSELRIINFTKLAPNSASCHSSFLKNNRPISFSDYFWISVSSKWRFSPVIIHRFWMEYFNSSTMEIPVQFRTSVWTLGVLLTVLCKNNIHYRIIK